MNRRFSSLLAQNYLLCGLPEALLHSCLDESTRAPSLFGNPPNMRLVCCRLNG